VPEGTPQDSLPVDGWVDFRLGYQPAFDGLRGLGVTTFILYHGVASYEAALRSWLLPGAYLWLELFFVQSGFLITSLLLEEWFRTGSIRLRAFYARRVLRLFPALVAVVGVSVVALLTLDQFRGNDEPWLEVWGALFYFQNWINAFGVNTFPYYLSHTWSLSIEEQFYLVVPVLVVVLLRFGGKLRHAMPLLIGGVLLSAAWMAALATTLPEGSKVYGRLYYGTDTRAQGLLIGVALAFAVHSGLWLTTERHAGIARRWGMVGTFVLIVLLFTADLHDRPMYYGMFLVCSTGVAGMLSEIVRHPNGWLATLLSRPPLRWAGERTYGLYLWHWPVMLIFAWFVPNWAEFPTVTAQVVLSFLVAAASYRLIERPIILRFAPRFARITPEREEAHQRSLAAVAAAPSISSSGAVA
jgi:peptidoglycan/LPS O-acetylase OafA/YrhL